MPHSIDRTRTYRHRIDGGKFHIHRCYNTPTGGWEYEIANVFTGTTRTVNDRTLRTDFVHTN